MDEGKSRKWVEAPICPYCGARSRIVRGSVLYPGRPEIRERKFWKCDGGCDAFVGCYKKTSKPLGRLANKELRELKVAAHQAFDPLWQSKLMSRSSAYLILAHELGLTPEECHIGQFDVEQCKQTVYACLQLTLDWDRCSATGEKPRIEEIFEKICKHSMKEKDNEQEGPAEEAREEEPSSEVHTSPVSGDSGRG